jgi:hypothetical protein
MKTTYIQFLTFMYLCIVNLVGYLENTCIFSFHFYTDPVFMHHIMHYAYLFCAPCFTLVRLRKRKILHTITLKTEAVCFSETLTSTFQTTWCHNPHFLSLNLHCYVNFSEETAAIQEAQLPLPQRLDFFIKYHRKHFLIFPSLSSSKLAFKLIKLFSE